MFGPKMFMIYLLIFIVFLVGGCGSSNSNAPSFNPGSGKHPANWVVGHRAAYETNPNQCRDCHGADMNLLTGSGGITKIGCFNRNADSRCHTDGHGPRSLIHVLPFTNPAVHGPQARANLSICQACHGEPGGPGSNARFNLTIGFLATGCEKTPGCHKPYAGHPAPWRNHPSAGNIANACTVCHGAAYEGGAVAPACSTCHVSLATGEVPVQGECISCHSKPPNGTSAPNIAGAHAKHTALTGITGVCDSCHSGAGTGTLLHANGTVNVAFLAKFSARSSVASFNSSSLTCTNVSCHGGQTTPNWQTGSITVSTQCVNCHSYGTTQYNSYFSGMHYFHTLPPASGGAVGLACTECHDTTKLATKHFTSLTVPTLEPGAAAATIRTDVRYNGTTCLPVVGSFSISVCHFTSTVSRTW